MRRIAVIALAACSGGSAPTREPPVAEAPRRYVPVGPFAVGEVQPPGWELDGVDVDAGLRFMVAGGHSPYSMFEIQPGCQGDCKHELLAGQLATSMRRLRDSLAADGGGCVTRWIHEPGEVRPGVWVIDLERTGAPACSEAFVEVDYIDPAADQWLHCGARLFRDDIALAPVVMATCGRLAYRVGPADDPLVTLFDRRLAMVGDHVTLPPLDGWRFASWLDKNGFELAEIRMRSIAGLSQLYIRRQLCPRCGGDAGRVARIENDRTNGEGLERPPLAEVGPHLWIERFPYHASLRVFAAAIAPGKPGYLECDATLLNEDEAHADRIEAFCRAVLERWRDEP